MYEARTFPVGHATWSWWADRGARRVEATATYGSTLQIDRGRRCGRRWQWRPGRTFTFYVQNYADSICWEKMICIASALVFRLMLLSHTHTLSHSIMMRHGHNGQRKTDFLCFLHLQVQSQPLENTQTLKGPEAPVVKNRWTRRSLETAPTDATAQRASRWPRSEIV